MIAQNCFLYCLLPTVVASAVGLQTDEIETKFLHANSISEFSHSLGHSRPSRLARNATYDGSCLKADIRRAPTGLVLEVEVAEGLAGGVLHDEARVVCSSTMQGGGKRRAEGMERGSAWCLQEKKNPKQRNRLGSRGRCLN
jgi:hypothetical protein